MRRSLPSLLLFALVALSILTACGSPTPATATPTALVGAGATPAHQRPNSNRDRRRHRDERRHRHARQGRHARHDGGHPGGGLHHRPRLPG